MGPILNSYGIMGVFLITNALLWTECHKSHYMTLNRNNQWKLQLATHTVQIKQQGGLCPTVAFSETCLKHRSVYTEGNFMNEIYNLNLLGIMLVYYFVPFIFSNPYPLF